MKKLLNCFKFLMIVIIMLFINKVNVPKDNGTVENNNFNKTLDLTAMAIKIEEIRKSDLYYPLDTFVGDLTAYVADCPLCGGTLGCTGQNVLDGTTTYYDNEYGTVNILASSSNLACGSIITYEVNNEKVTGIVLDRGVLGTDLDLLVSNVNDAYSRGRKNISYNVLRFGWTRNG